MKKCKLLAALLFCCAVGFSQTTQRVGVNTDKPGATLDVNGNLSIRDLDIQTGTDPNTYEQLYWNIQSKRVEVPNDNIQKPFYLVQYDLLTNSDGTRDFADYIADFDTKINANDYYAIITQAFPIPSKDYGRYHDNDLIGIRHVEINGQTYFPGVTDYEVGRETGNGNSDYNDEVNPIRKVEAFTKGGTWHLTLDYLAARPASYVNGRRRLEFDWKVNVLFIAKSFANSIDFGTKSLSKPEEAKGEMGGNPLLKK